MSALDGHFVLDSYNGRHLSAGRNGSSDTEGNLNDFEVFQFEFSDRSVAEGWARYGVRSHAHNKWLRVHKESQWRGKAVIDGNRRGESETFRFHQSPRNAEAVNIQTKDGIWLSCEDNKAVFRYVQVTGVQEDWYIRRLDSANLPGPGGSFLRSVGAVTFGALTGFVTAGPAGALAGGIISGFAEHELGKVEGNVGIDF